MRLPNRAERRAYNKKNKSSYTLQDFALSRAIQGLQSGENIDWLKKYLPTDMVAHKDNWELFPDGTKVMLNYEGINARPKKYLSDQLKNWVEENKEEIFTIFRDKEDPDTKGLISVRYVDSTKDTEMSKTWLFDLYSDLLVWSDEENKFVAPQKVEDVENELTNVKQSLALLDNMEDFPVYGGKRNMVEKIRENIHNHENGIEYITDPVEWQNMDSTLLELINNFGETEETNEETNNTELTKEGGEQ